jgi:hypothetical protein
VAASAFTLHYHALRLSSAQLEKTARWSLQQRSKKIVLHINRVVLRCRE